MGLPKFAAETVPIGQRNVRNKVLQKNIAMWNVYLIYLNKIGLLHIQGDMCMGLPKFAAQT